MERRAKRGKLGKLATRTLLTVWLSCFHNFIYLLDATFHKVHKHHVYA